VDISVLLTVFTGSCSFLLLTTHLMLTFRLRFPQKKIFSGIRETFLQPGGFSGLSVQLAATLGVGNISGLALAVVSGGPGAVFWCWFSGVLGIATAYAEALLSLKTRRPPTPCGTWNAAGNRLGRFYAFMIACAGIPLGAMIPSSSLARSVSPSPLYTVLPLTVLTALVVLGGNTRIRQTCERLIPATALLYSVSCIGIIVCCRDCLPAALQSIFREAFRFHGVFAGLGGGTVITVTGFHAMREGIARGLFSNEAGLGTAGIAAGEFSPGDAEKQALVSATGVFWDTVIFCALTGVAFVCAFLSFGRPSPDADTFCRAVFDLLPAGHTVLTVCLLALGTACIFGWCSIGSRAFSHAFPACFSKAYPILWTAAVFCGAFASQDILWQVSDFLNAAALLLNILILWKYYGLFIYYHKQDSQF